MDDIDEKNFERDEIERDAEGMNKDEAKEVYEESVAHLPVEDRPSFDTWLEENKD